MAKNAQESEAKRAALKRAGEILREARGKRPVSDVAKIVGVSVPRYQHWEYGNNKPPFDLWEKLGNTLGLHIATIYGASVQPQHTDKMISAKAVAGLVQGIERNLAMLKVLCSDTTTTRQLKRAGIHAKRAGKTVAERQS